MIVFVEIEGESESKVSIIDRDFLHGSSNELPKILPAIQVEKQGNTGMDCY